jgi:superfamily II RNA helicase
MVKDCNTVYENDKYNVYFKEFTFDLSDFQKYSIEAIVSGNHSLVTAHTGSGKTLPAEFAIDFFVKSGKKVIYTSPIKALSNQKFHEFSEKFPHIEFGILTGDIKHNPGADVLIMTTEILNNTLFQLKLKDKNKEYNPVLHFDMNIEEELACVIFDEIHYINDADRGKVWEESIINIPSHIQLVMLSATIDNPKRFAGWIETIKQGEKEVYLSYTYHRVVPLEHYFYYTFGDHVMNLVKDKQIEGDFKSIHNKILPIKENTNFNINVYNKLTGVEKYLEKYHINSKPNTQFVLNSISRYLKMNNMLPAICFGFSRALLEKLADYMEINFYDDDNKMSNTIEDKVKKHLMKLNNYKEYINLPEFTNFIKYLKKGIAIHHSGITPVFREIIELLFAKGDIKFLFATETMSIGINMPTKTVLFTDLEKWDGKEKRLLLSHEYTQMAGRAGRRNIDKIGYVIHLSNLFKTPGEIGYRNLLNNKPQLLESKFKISYNLILSLIHEKQYNYIDYVKKSMLNLTMNDQINVIDKNIEKLVSELNVVNKTEIDDFYNEFKKYDKLKKNLQFVKPKLRNKYQNNLKSLECEDWFKYYNDYKAIDEKNEEIKYLVKRKTEIDNYLKEQIELMIYLLNANGFLITSNAIDTSNINSTFILTEKGKIALEIKEVNILIFSDILLKTNYLENFNIEEIIIILGIFNNLKVKEEYREFNPSNQKIALLYKKICEISINYENKEIENNLDTGLEYDFNIDLEEFLVNWLKCKNDTNCIMIINNFIWKKGLFTGELIKSVLKIVNITNELINICETYEKINLLNKLQYIEEKLLKFIMTNKSLYV